MDENKPNYDKINSEWVTRSIEYHGQPLHKVWEGEHGIESLYNLGVRNPDYMMYQARQKHFVFQDRAKRLKIHSFIAKKAPELFSTDTENQCARSKHMSSNRNEIVKSDAKGEQSISRD